MSGTGSRGASQPAASDGARGATQPVASAGWRPRCYSWPPDNAVKFNVISFNFGINQAMLDSERQWNNKHGKKLRAIIHKCGDVALGDFIFGSEMGDHREGFEQSPANFREVVGLAHPGAECNTNGAYSSVWNVANRKESTLLEQGTYTVPCGRDVDMHWQIFLIQRSGASQSAVVKPVGLIVGNLHIVCATNPPSEATKKRIVKMCLNYLADLHVPDWESSSDNPVARILVGDCSLKREGAEAATQCAKSPASGIPCQTRGALSKWQVLSSEEGLSGDVMFATGCTLEPVSVAIGKSFRDRGMRNGSHDAVAATIRIPWADVQEDVTDRVSDTGAPQPSVASVSSRRSAQSLDLEAAGQNPQGGKKARTLQAVDLEDDAPLLFSVLFSLRL